MVNDINEVIASLAKIDNASAMIMESTRKEKTAYAEEIKKKTKDFDDQLAKELDVKVSALHDSLDADNKHLIDACKEESEQTIKKLDDIFNENKAVWADTIFNNIIKE